MIDSIESTVKVWLNLYLLLELYDKQGTSYGLRLIGSCSVPGMNYCFQQKLATNRNDCQWKYNKSFSKLLLSVGSQQKLFQLAWKGKIEYEHVVPLSFYSRLVLLRADACCT